ncbi:MAG: HAD-IIA family hydrolase [Candidatus Sumerlaeaceae bacterium]
MKSVAAIRHVALDMDGTIYKGGTLFDFTVPFLSLLKQLGIGHTFLTNNSSKSVEDYVKHLRQLGVPASSQDIFTSTDSTILYLRETFPQHQRLFVLGTDSLVAHFTSNGYTVLPDDLEPELVIVGFHTSLPYAQLCKACWWISRGVPYVATHPDLICPTDLPTVLVDCGAVCACIESATGHKPTAVLGKPDHRMLSGIMRRHGLQAHELAMAGDRIYTDVTMSVHSGTFGVLVLTGEATVEDARKADVQPDLVVPSLREFGEMLAQARSAQPNQPRTVAAKESH